MPRLTESTRLERRSRIAEAALACFVRDGFANTSMADIITESGLSAGSIYSHFTSKSEVLRYAIAGVLEERLLDSLSTAGASDPLEPGRCFLLIAESAQFEHSRAQLLLQVWAQVPRDPELAALAHTNLARITEIAATALTPWATARSGGDGATGRTLAQRSASAVVTAMTGYVVRVAVDPAISADVLRASVAATLAGA